MVTRVWNGTNGAWQTPANWYPYGIPKRGDVATITAGTVHATTVDTSYRTIVVNAIRGDITTGLSVTRGSLGVGSVTYLIGTGNVAFLTLDHVVTNGTLVASSGPGEVVIPNSSSAVNHGWWAISSPTGSSLTTIANGQFTNAGTIESGQNASFALSTIKDQFNYGTYQVDPGGRMLFLSGDHTPPTFTTITNAGSLFVNGGLMYVAANVAQTGTGKTTVTGDGTLTLAGKYDGGTIEIRSGMLNFVPTDQSPGPIAASALHSAIVFSGASGEIDMGEAILSATYRPNTNDLLVEVPWKGGEAQAADFQLSGSYTADEFNVNTSTGQIIFHNH